MKNRIDDQIVLGGFAKGVNSYGRCLLLGIAIAVAALTAVAWIYLILERL